MNKAVGMLLAGMFVLITVTNAMSAVFDPAPNGPVNTVMVKPDGRILIGGDFSTVSGLAYGRIAQLEADGTPDFVSLISATSFDGPVRAITLQADGKILVGGDFSTVIDTSDIDIVYSYGGMARLNADGTVDPTFKDVGASLAGGAASIRAITIQPQPGNVSTGGYILVGGSFDTIGGLVRNGMARISNDLNGTVDSFDPVLSGSGQATAVVNAIEMQGTNVLLGGDFFVDTGTYHTYMLARVDWSGFLDTTFTPMFPNGPVNRIVGQGGGNLLLVGSFSAFDNRGNAVPPSTTVTRSGVAKIAASGVLDGTFNPNVPGAVTAVVQSDGKIIIGGLFSTVGVSPARMVARLTTEGVLDNTFNGTVNTGTQVTALAIQADGGVVAGGQFATVNGFSRNNIARFEPGSGGVLNSYNPIVDTNVAASTVLANGKTLIGGTFTTVNGTPMVNIARLNRDGSLDTSFNAHLAAGVSGGTVKGILATAEGKLVVVGLFSFDGGATTTRITRLNIDGSIDGTFTPVSIDKTISGAILQADGKVIVGGVFTTPRSYIARLNTNGTFDSSFTPALNNAVFTLAMQSDGKILVGGMFTTVNGVSRNRIVRLNQLGGTTDTTFTSPVTTTTGTVAVIAVQNGEKILVGCTSLTGASECIPGYKWMGRLTTTGSIDTLSGLYKPNNGVDTILPQADGSFWIGGNFTLLGTMASNRLARMNQDGTADLTFAGGADNWVYSANYHPDGGVLVAGLFTQFDGQAKKGLVRVNAPATGTQTLSLSQDGLRADLDREGSLPAGSYVLFSYSDDSGVNWKALTAAVARKTGGWVATFPADGIPRGQSILLKADIYQEGGLNGASLSIEEVSITACLPPAAASVSLVSTSRDSFSFSWNKPPSTTGSLVDVSTDPLFQSGLIQPYSRLDLGAASGASVTGLSPATTYYFRVTPYNTCSAGPVSPAGDTTTMSRLTVVVDGAGEGTVSSAPAGIMCSKPNEAPVTCWADYDTGSHVVVLTPVAGAKSQASAFSGGCTPVAGGNCDAIMNGDKSVSYGFDLKKTVRLTINMAETIYATIADAYALAVSGSKLDVVSDTLVENLTFGKSVGVTINGGFPSGFGGPATGTTTIQGSMAVDAGEVSINRIILNYPLTVTGGKVIANGLTVRGLP